MALARTWDKTSGKVVSTVYDAYLDRLSKPSDIQEYLPFFYETARSYPGVRVLELGARTGNSTLAFLAGAQEAQGSVVSVDIDDVPRAVNGMAPWRKIPWWAFIRGDDMDPAVQAQLPGEVDVLFLDTSHEYEHTLAELHAYMPRVAPGGVALFHDTRLRGWPGYEPPTELPPVRQALDDYCTEKDISWEEIPGQWGLGVIR